MSCYISYLIILDGNLFSTRVCFSCNLPLFVITYNLQYTHISCGIPSLRSNDQSVLYFVVNNISVSVYLNVYLTNTCARLSSQIMILFIIILFKTMATLCTY